MAFFKSFATVVSNPTTNSMIWNNFTHLFITITKKTHTYTYVNALPKYMTSEVYLHVCKGEHQNLNHDRWNSLSHQEAVLHLSYNIMWPTRWTNMDDGYDLNFKGKSHELY